MAGHRRERGTERAITVRAERRRAVFAQNLAAARTPSAQVAAASAYASSVITWLNGRGDAVDAASRIVRATTTVINELVAAVERDCR